MELFKVRDNAVGPAVLHELQELIQAIEFRNWWEKNEKSHPWGSVSNSPKTTTPVPLLEVPEECSTPRRPWCGREFRRVLNRLDALVGGEKREESMALRLDPHGHLRDE